MAKGNGDFTNDDLAAWAKGDGGGGNADEGAEGGAEGGDDAGDEEGGGGKDPGTVLTEAADALDKSLSEMAGITLPADEDGDFKKVWEEFEEEAKALSEKAREAVQARDDLKDDDDEEDDDADSTDDDDQGGGDADAGAGGDDD